MAVDVEESSWMNHLRESRVDQIVTKGDQDSAAALKQRPPWSLADSSPQRSCKVESLQVQRSCPSHLGLTQNPVGRLHSQGSIVMGHRVLYESVVEVVVLVKALGFEKLSHQSPSRVVDGQM